MERNWKNFRLDKNKVKRFGLNVLAYIFICSTFAMILVQGIMTAPTLN